MMYADLNQREAAELKDREITAILPIGATEVCGKCGDDEGGGQDSV